MIQIIPFIFLGIFLVLMVVGFIIFSYLFIIGGIVGLILFSLFWLYTKILNRKIQKNSAPKHKNRTIDHE